MRAIGIDFGEDSIKIVELVQNKKSISVHSVFEKKLSAGVSDHDKEIEAIEYVRQVLAQNDFTGARFCMALRQDKVTIRTKSFPFSDRIKIQKSLSFEMEEDIPFDPDNCIFDYKVISYEGSGVEVLAIAVPKNHIEKCLSLAKDFGVELYTLTVEGLAFANLIENWQEAPPQIATKEILSADDLALETNESVATKAIDIVINLGHKRTLLTGYSQGRLIFVRSLIWGADAILQEIVRKYQLPYVEAQKVLQTQASLYLNKQNKSFEELNLASTIEKSLRELIRDLQISLLEIRSEHNAYIHQIYLTGGLSGLDNLGAYLTQNLEIACNPTQLLNQYLQSTQTSLPYDQLQTKFTTAVGVAIEAFKKPKNPALQLIKGDFVQKNNLLKTFWAEWGTLSQIAIAALIVLFTWGYLREDFSTQLTEKGDEVLKTHAKNVARLPKKQANEKGVTKYIKDNKKRAQEMKMISQLASMNSAMDILKKISEQSPALSQAKIDLMQFTVKDETVQLAGYANSPREVALLTERLSSLSVKNKITEERPQIASQPNRVTFALSFTVDRGLVK